MIPPRVNRIRLPHPADPGEQRTVLAVLAAVLLLQIELVSNRPVNWDDAEDAEGPAGSAAAEDAYPLSRLRQALQLGGFAHIEFEYEPVAAAYHYEGRLTPSLPMIEPLQESYFAWLMKVWMLKPAYLATLKGRV